MTDLGGVERARVRPRSGPSARMGGFTLVELLIVIAIIAIVASIAIPNLLTARLNANESATIGALRSIASAQTQCQTTGGIDANRNGIGEYGFFAELSGAIGVRSNSSGGVGSVRLDPPLLSGGFMNVNANGRVRRSGYIFQMFLPDTLCSGLGESAGGGAGGVSISAVEAEKVWCCYAWPASRGNSGKRAFFTNQMGEVFGCGNTVARYNGTLATPAFDAAFVAGSVSMSDGAASSALGNDGETWIIVN